MTKSEITEGNIMYPELHIGSRTIPVYGLCIVMGACLAVAIATLFLQKKYAEFHSRDDIIVGSVFAMIGVFIGGKIVYLLINLPLIVEKWDKICALPGGLASLVTSGFVFYGGLFGAVAMLWIYARAWKVSFLSLLLNLVPVIPIVHAFGRIGCFMAGCCYGIEYHGMFYIQYTQAVGGAPNGVDLFPVQLVEALCNILIFLVLYLIWRKKPWSGRTIGVYLILYAVVRFVLEFVRGDVERGNMFGISTSQWISLLLIPIGIFVIMKEGIINLKKSKSSPRQRGNFPKTEDRDFTS